MARLVIALTMQTTEMQAINMKPESRVLVSSCFNDTQGNPVKTGQSNIAEGV